MLGDRIDSQVTFAIRAVREASASLAEFSRSDKPSCARTSEKMRSTAKAAEAAGEQSRPHTPRLRGSPELKSGRGRLQALYHYNQAVAHLELALGLPLEEAFAPPSATAPPSK